MSVYPPFFAIATPKWSSKFAATCLMCTLERLKVMIWLDSTRVSYLIKTNISYGCKIRSEFHLKCILSGTKTPLYLDPQRFAQRAHIWMNQQIFCERVYFPRSEDVCWKLDQIRNKKKKTSSVKRWIAFDMV